MKNQVKPENVIGFVKIVEGFIFTLVDKEKHTFMVEITQDGTDFSDVRTMGHNTWRLGKFTRILNEINPKPKEKKTRERKPRTPRVSKPKVINGVEFKRIEKNKETRRVKVVAEGYEGVYEMSESTWYRGKFFNNIMKFLKKAVNVVTEIFTKSTEVMMLIPLDKVVSRKLEETAKDLYDLKEARYRKELKKVYKKLAKKFHPDNLETGNVDLCTQIIETYKKRDEGLDYLERSCFEVEGFTLEESQELYEELYDVCRDVYGY